MGEGIEPWPGMQKLWIVEHEEINGDRRWVVWAPTEEEAMERVRMYLFEHYPDWHAKEQLPDFARPLEFDALGVCQVY